MHSRNKVILLGGCFEGKCKESILASQKTALEYSANNVQERLISGMRKNSDLKVLSAPFCGSFPKDSKTFIFHAPASQSDIEYVSFNNVWGFRNISRAISLEKRLLQIINHSDDKSINIIVYSPHTPFLEAAVFAKKNDRAIKICLIVPDLPQYLNLRNNISLAYKVAKKFDVKHFYDLCKYVDSYVFFAPAMTEMFDINKKRIIVSEGILEDNVFEINEEKRKSISKEKNIKYIVYTGKMYEKFGVKDLVDAFMTLSDSSYRLILCGRGDVDEYINEQAALDSRIKALGQVSPDESRLWQLKADVLVNPRSNAEDFVKYSFPSKNLEYLAVGAPVVAHYLKGMPEIYRDFIFCISDEGNHIDAIRNAILKALDVTDNSDRYNEFKDYAKDHLTESVIAQKILEW